MEQGENYLNRKTRPVTYIITLERSDPIFEMSHFQTENIYGRMRKTLMICVQYH